MILKRARRTHGAEVRAVERLAAGARSELVGEVTISAAAAYAAAVLAPKLAGLWQRHPDLSIRLLGEAHLASLERREADIALSLSWPERGDLTGARIGSMAFRLYADPAYLAETAGVAWRFIGIEGPVAGSPRQATLERVAGKKRSPFALTMSGSRRP